MERSEKLRLSADQEYGCCFKQGMFVRLYEQSLYWFCTYIKPLKPMLERVKGGDAVVYGGLPVASFEKLVSEGVPLAAEATEYGWRWPYTARAGGKAENAAAFQRGQGRKAGSRRRAGARLVRKAGVAVPTRGSALC